MFIKDYFKQLFQIPIKFHWSSYLLLVVFGFNGVQGIIILSLLFALVFLHEHGHIYAASRYGIGTSQITFSALGGMAHLNSSNFSNKQDLVISIAGPLVNFILFAFGSLTLLGLTYLTSINNQSIFNALVLFSLINIQLALFNLIPAYPLDGGRILRSTLALFKVRPSKIRTIVMYVARAIAVMMFAAGIYFAIYSLVFVSIFVYMYSDKQDF